MLIDFVYFELGIGTTEQEGRIGIRTQTWHSSHLCLAWLSSKGSYHCNNPWRRCLSRSWLCSRPKRLLLVLWNKQDSRAFPTAKGCVGNHIYEPTVTIGGNYVLGVCVEVRGLALVVLHKISSQLMGNRRFSFYLLPMLAAFPRLGFP